MSQNNYYSLLESMSDMGIFLCEGIDDMKKFYPNISGDDFLTFIALDPTYKEGSDKAGQYAKWILGLANKNGGKLDRINHITDILTRFDKEKKQLKDKDIMKFKSVEELESYLNDDENYNDLSHRQEVRQRQKDRHNVDLRKDAKLVYEDNDWEVWIPKTYAASCKLGQGTSWCTASTESSIYYDDYTEEGYLYIIINKKDRNEKYQFHLETDSFMDKDDNEIDLFTFFKEERNRGLLNKFKELYDYIYDIYENIDRDFTTMHYPSDFEGVPNDIYSKQLKNVVFDEGVTSIGRSAFSDCYSLTSVVIGDSVTSIGDYAFSSCNSLTSITIPDSVTSIGVNAFERCSNLTSITIPDGVMSIGDKVFFACSSLTSVVIPYGVTSIGRSAFYACKSLTSVVVPDSVKSIGDYAFECCYDLTSIEIPDSVTSIGELAFGYCGRLTSIKYTGSAKQWKQIKKGEGWAKGIPCKSIKLVDSVGIDESLNRYTNDNKHMHRE